MMGWERHTPFPLATSPVKHFSPTLPSLPHTHTYTRQVCLHGNAEYGRATHRAGGRCVESRLAVRVVGQGGRG
jgi:hypothetical protein